MKKFIIWTLTLLLALILTGAGCSRRPADEISTDSRGDISSVSSPVQTVPDEKETTGTEPTLPTSETDPSPKDVEKRTADPGVNTRGEPSEEIFTTAETTEPEETTVEDTTEETEDPSESTEETGSETQESTDEPTSEEETTPDATRPPEPTTAAPTEAEPTTAAPTEAEPTTEAPTVPPETGTPTMPTGETPELTGERLAGIDYDSYLPVPEWVGRGGAHGSLAMQYGGYYTKDSWSKVIYLTFCMDYENGYTNQMMDTLASKGVSGVFFITGTYLANRPDMARAILNRGHLLGSHSYRHRYTSELSDVTLINDLVLSRRLFANTLGYYLQYYRPAYGFITERDMYLARKVGLTTVMFSFYYRDFDLSAQPSYWEALQSLKNGLQPGAIYYLHVTPCNIQALPEFIDFARSQGYTFLRLDQSPGSGTTPTSPPTEEPPTEEPTTGEPTEEPTEEPVTEEPTEDPTEEPTGEDPTEEPGTEDLTGEPTGDPGMEKDPTEDPGTEESEEETDAETSDTEDSSDDAGEETETQP